MNDRLRVMQRQPRRISITLSYHVHQALLDRSEEEGRSVSNLCAFLLEDALREADRQGLTAGALPNGGLQPHGLKPQTMRTLGHGHGGNGHGDGAAHLRHSGHH